MATDDQRVIKAFEVFRTERKRRMAAYVLKHKEIFLELARLEGNLVVIQTLTNLKEGDTSSIKLVLN
jgi:hypothetical protein